MESKPYEGKPYEGKPYEGKPYEGKQYESQPTESKYEIPKPVELKDKNHIDKIKETKNPEYSTTPVPATASYAPVVQPTPKTPSVYKLVNRRRFD